MKITSVLYFFFSFILSTRASDLSRLEKCPDIPPVRGFNIEKWATGIWNQIYSDTENLLNVFGDLKCKEKELTYDAESDTIVVESYAVSKSHDVPKWQSSVGQVGDKPGKFTFRIPSGIQMNFEAIDFRVLDTDYTSYSYGYGCAKDKTENKAYLSVSASSRSRAIPSGVLKDVTKLFKANGLNITLAPVDWRDCRARCPAE